MAMSSRPEFTSRACFFFLLWSRAIFKRIRTTINIAKQIKQAVMTAMAVRLKESVERENKLSEKAIHQEKKTNSGYKHFHFILDVSYVATYIIRSDG